MQQPNPRILIPCPNCGWNKDRTTHTYGSYKCYRVGTTIILRCKTCRAEIKYVIIQGATPENETYTS